VRDVGVDDLEGFDAVVLLATVCSDPVGNLNPGSMYGINHRAFEQAREAGVSRFVFASPCSLYGKAGEDMLDETAGLAPVKPYGDSKALAEHAIAKLADNGFSPTSIRNVTAYGVLDRLEPLRRLRPSRSPSGQRLCGVAAARGSVGSAAPCA
jgi:nucleoside-diphosphate-sugar epimerase